ncbi:Sodium channel protein para [Dirofilaria immitis]
MYAKQYPKSWSEQPGSNGSSTRIQRHDISTDTLHVNIGEQIKLDADEAVKDLGLRIARTRERAAGNGNGNGISCGHRHRHRNFENGIFCLLL